MKKFNILYIIVPLAAIGIWQLSQQYQQQTVLFYGFAETKETEINLEHAVQVNQIFVTSGQRVKKGMPLLEAAHNKLPLKLNEIVHETEETKVERLLWKKDIEAAIDKLKTKKATTQSEINGKIAQIKAKIAQNQNLLSNLTTTENGTTTSKTTQAKINALQQELAMALLPLDQEIERLNNRLRTPQDPYYVKLKKLQSEQSFYEDKGRKLDIFAPSDGLIGNIHCKEAENISSFKTLITFYEENPTLVKGYVHEKLIVHVQIGDTMTVASSLQDKFQCKGIVTGLGSRIVEIPERLRKHKALKDYGREVLIKIPADNQFLQKEKVILKIDKTITVSDSFFDLAKKNDAKGNANISSQLGQ